MARDYLVYLAGPIKGLNYQGATGWRDYVVRAFEGVCPEIRCLSPMRAKEYLRDETVIDADNRAPYEQPLSTDKGIVTRDRLDCTRADLVLFNLTEAPDRFSAGTCIEIGWADAHRIPMVAAVTPGSVWADHGMVRQLISFQVPTLNDAIELVPAILLPERACRSSYQVGWAA